MPSLESVGARATTTVHKTILLMNTSQPIKEAYVRPETISVEIDMKESILQDISNPDGTTDPLDPYEY